MVHDNQGDALPPAVACPLALALTVGPRLMLQLSSQQRTVFPLQARLFLAPHSESYPSPHINNWLSWRVRALVKCRPRHKGLRVVRVRPASVRFIGRAGKYGKLGRPQEDIDPPPTSVGSSTKTTAEAALKSSPTAAAVIDSRATRTEGSSLRGGPGDGAHGQGVAAGTAELGYALQEC